MHLTDEFTRRISFLTNRKEVEARRANRRLHVGNPKEDYCVTTRPQLASERGHRIEMSWDTWSREGDSHKLNEYIPAGSRKEVALHRAMPGDSRPDQPNEPGSPK